MVHSSSEPSMPTTPSAPPAPQVVLLQVPLTGHDLNQAPAKLLTPTRTSSSVLNQPPTQSLVQVKQPAPTPAITPAKAQSPNSCPTSPLSPTPTPAPPPSQGTVNGRTSGRKRTPKACDCCGPHGRGHNDASSHIKTPGRGRGGGGGRGRGTLREDTPKKDGRGRPRKIKILEIIDDEEDEDGDDQDDDKPMTTVAELAADAVDQSGIHNDASSPVKTPGRGRGRGRGRGGGRGRGRGTLPEMGRNLDGTPKKAGRGRPKKIKIFEISDDDEEDEDSDDQDDDKPMTTVAELAADAVDQSGILGDVSITTALGKEQTVGMGRGAGNKGEIGVKVTMGRGASAGRARGIGAPGAAVNSKMDVNISIVRGGGRGVVGGRGGVGMRGRGVRGQGSVSVGVRGEGVRGRGGIGLRGHCVIGQGVRGRGSIGVGVRGQGVRGRGSIGVGLRGQGVRGRGSIGVGLRGQGVRGRGSIGVGARGQGVRGQSSAGVRGQGLIGRGRVATGSVGVGIQRVVSSNFGGQTGSGSVAQSKNAKSMPVPTREDVDMEVEERANSTSPPENGNGVGDTVVKSACVGTTASGTGSAGGTATAGTRGGGTDNGFIAKSQVTERACGDSLSGSGPVTDSTSTSESPKEPDTAMQIDSQSPNDKTLPVPLSNGNASTLTDEHCRPSPAENSAFSPDMVSPPSKDCIVVHTTQHRWALKDHRLYCLPGTWEKEEEEAKQGKEPSEQTDGQQTEKQTDGQSQEKDDADSELTEMIHEFLESFYTKYGSFIPLSETDVVEHLKKNGNCDLSNRKLNIPAEVSRYKAGLASAPVGGFMVTYNKHTLSLEDLSTLDEQNWLNDQIINMYGELIMEATQHKVHFFNSFFHRQLVAKGYEGVKRWTKKEDLFSKQLLLVPIHLEIHWSLIAVDIATKTISYYDSQGIVFKHTIDNIMKYIQAEAKEKEQTDFQKGWKMVIIKGIPQQKNDSDCGVFVLEYCRRLSVKQPLRFSQEDMPRIRKRLYKELCECRLNDC